MIKQWPQWNTMENQSLTTKENFPFLRSRVIFSSFLDIVSSFLVNRTCYPNCGNLDREPRGRTLFKHGFWLAVEFTGGTRFFVTGNFCILKQNSTFLYGSRPIRFKSIIFVRRWLQIFLLVPSFRTEISPQSGRHMFWNSRYTNDRYVLGVEIVWNISSCSIKLVIIVETLFDDVFHSLDDIFLY